MGADKVIEMNDMLLTSLVPISAETFASLQVEQAMTGVSDPQLDALAEGYDAAATDQERSDYLVLAARLFGVNKKQVSRTTPLSDHPWVMSQVAEKLRGTRNSPAFLSAGVPSSHSSRSSSGMKLSEGETLSAHSIREDWDLCRAGYAMIERIQREFLADGIEHDETDRKFLCRLKSVYDDAFEMYFAAVERSPIPLRDIKAETNLDTLPPMTRLAFELSNRLYQLANSVSLFTQRRLNLV